MSHNDITGAKIATKPASDAYREGFDRIFGKPTAPPVGCVKCPRDPAKACGYCMDWNKRGGAG